MNKQNKIIIGVTIFLAIIILIFAIINNKNKIAENNTAGFYDNFAKCLTEKGAVIYGTEWCFHCKEQKAVFGDSFKFIKYVECPDNIQLCLDKGIQGYPIWLIGTSTKIEGFNKNKTMKELSEISGCELPEIVFN